MGYVTCANNSIFSLLKFLHFSYNGGEKAQVLF